MRLAGLRTPASPNGTAPIAVIKGYMADIRHLVYGTPTGAPASMAAPSRANGSTSHKEM
ncbi:hypothetical protein MNKW57_17540 [Biformimicrobium ophioploci]|uniref:Uncharacterized protein n=1 Tax=Biformimicrobium ophioploci TaxID=3036711 RepID=A0ABQ6LZB5_9GAMM|nr:hypothetical protein MNKW57_17540 [Microbulbifer sp. NKW57]